MNNERNILTLNTTVSKYSTLMMELDIARNAGYRSIEIISSKVWDYLDAGHSQFELKQALDGFVVQGIGALLDIERQGDDAKKLFKDAEELFQLAHVIDAKGVQIVTGPLDVNAVIRYKNNRSTSEYTGLLSSSLDEQIALTAKNLRALADLAQQFGLLIYFEALSWTPLNTLAKQVRLLEQTSRDNVKMVIDYWHCYTSGDTPETLAKLDKQWIYGVHVCDSLAYDGGIPDEVVLRDVSTGQGVLDLVAWTDAVKATGYDHWWSSETFCRKQQQQNSYHVAKQLKAQLAALIAS
ncbi:sugar phosphate isomerase/epimerase family protein [Pectobacterium sp. A5351]|uniref:sugar phosphate isomerase/epimerase family protein n=1 Tax=Pectobacterium sp. A5351 TaxID=2914983 RepID=UPI0023303DC4|nr:sugar phosphate isomerase/epimerase family protein [Pectobacterium sp. A5351]WCG84645.1 sugar phosphate isomerase/epimerase [Pectobacterium sp. A5351]